MAEAAHAEMPGDVVRVHSRMTNSARVKEFESFLRERGFAIAVASRAKVTVSDDAAGACILIAERESGARGVLPVDASAAQLDAALRAVAVGLNVGVPYSGRFSSIDDDNAPSPLTPRELEILIALSDGLSNKEIARRFDISLHTVKFHAESIFRKLGATTRADAVARGLRKGLVHL